MSGTTWTKFFWSDWQSDPALRLCSYAARGLWMDMLCIAAAHDPIGYVAVAGRSLTETDIARMTGGSESEVSSLLGELDRNGVFSRDAKGRIFSRRMTEDAKRAALARKNGRNGGNPTLKKQKRIQEPDNRSDMATVKPQEPEASIQKSPPSDANASEPPQGRQAQSSLFETPPQPQEKTRGTRLPNDWLPTPDQIRWGCAQGLNSDTVAAVAEQFRDFWVAKNGNGGVKRDWVATFRTWIRNHIDRHGTGPWPRHGGGATSGYRPGHGSIAAAARATLDHSGDDEQGDGGDGVPALAGPLRVVAGGRNG